VIFGEERLSHAEHRDNLARAVDKVFGNMNTDFSRAALPLSGGFDSRALLMMLKDKGLKQCVTWGLASSLNDTRNDAYIARKVAQHFGVEHQYLVTDADETGETIETILHRILVAGEGRVSRVAGYTDGFAVWKSLFEQDVHAIIRGDMIFGVDATATEFETRRLSRLTMLSDFHNLPDATELDIPPQQLGEAYSRRPGETLETWRDRCYQTFAVPAVLAALTDLKSAYVEVVNPLLSNSIVDCTRMHPDSLRTNKRLWKEIVQMHGPDIPIAETSAPMDVKLFVKKADVVDLILSELSSIDAPEVISRNLVRFIEDRVRVTEDLKVKRSRIRKAIRPFAPQRLRDFARRFQYKQDLDVNVLAFRAFLVCRMSRMLTRDAASIG
jgi:hypothetical protein